MAVDLVFASPYSAAYPVDLVFGAAEGATQDAECSFAIVMPALGFSGTCIYDNAVYRPTVRATGAGWQDAQEIAQPAIAARHGDSLHLRHADGIIWADARAAEHAAGGGWRPMPRREPAASARWAEGAARRPGDVLVPWISLGRARRDTAIRAQVAAPLGAVRAGGWQDRSRDRRPARAIGWQDGRAFPRAFDGAWHRGTPRRLWPALPWGEGWHPRPGVSPVDVPPQPPDERCYTPPPGGAVHLLLRDGRLASYPVELLFRCTAGGGAPAIVIPTLRAYVVSHSLSLVRLPDQTPIPAFSANVSADADSWCWSFSATCPASVMALLAGTPGAPAQVKLSVDGIDWVFAVESLRRSRKFGESRIEIGGRSVTALLADPYFEAREWLSTSQQLAQQIATGALEFTGVTLDWGIDDWLVPAGAWNHRGTPLSALARIAEAAGAVLQSVRAAAQLRLRPRYPVLPWNWATATPGVSLPLAAVMTDGYERRDMPDYNAVYVMGEAQGIVGHVKRAGTAGDVLAPPVVDALITAQETARGRGSAILGNTGPQAVVTLELPLLSASGVIDVGTLVEVAETAETWRGLVRGTRIAAELPRVRQSLTVERHL